MSVPHINGKKNWHIAAALSAVSDHMDVNVQMAIAAGYLSLQ
jgi:hypothetical protein